MTDAPEQWEAYKAKTGSHWLVMVAGHEPYTPNDTPGSEICVSWHPEAERIARMVAAAPELLEALDEALTDYADGVGMRHRTANLARAAIAKATGQDAGSVGSDPRDSSLIDEAIAGQEANLERLL